MSIYVFLRLFMSKRVEKPCFQTRKGKIGVLKTAFAYENHVIFYV